MNSIDERIKQALENENLELDEIIGSEGGVPEMMQNALKGSMGRALRIVLVMASIVFLGLVYDVWRFWTATTVEDQVFWGVWAILSGIVLIGLELWTWMEMNRASSVRAITRVELAIRDKGATLEKETNSP